MLSSPTNDQVVKERKCSKGVVIDDPDHEKDDPPHFQMSSACLKVGGIFRDVFQIISVMVDGLLASFGVISLIIAIIIGIVSWMRHFLFALMNLVSFHILLISSALIGTLVAICGTIGVIAVVQHRPLGLVLSVGGILMVLLMHSVVFFNFTTEWKANMDVGISSGVHQFDIHKLDTYYISDIQFAMGCCGASGPSDYNIANVQFSKGQVPPSCCDPSTDTKDINGVPFTCRVRLSEQLDNITAIDTKYAHQIGCREKINSSLWRFLLMIQISFIVLSILAVVIPITYSFLNQIFPLHPTP